MQDFQRKIDDGETAYVIGPPRSGTTLVGYLLAGLPGLLSLSEPHLAWDAMPTWKLHRFHRRLRRELGLAGLRPPYRGGHGAYAAYLARLSTASGYRQLVAKETWRGGAPLPEAWQSDGLLRTLHAGAAQRTALLIRHPLDTAASTIKLLQYSTGWIGHAARLRWANLPWFPNRYEVVAWAARNWAGFAEWCVQVGHRPLRYEDLVLQPKTAVPALCEALGVAYRADMLDLQEQRGSFGGLGDPGLMKKRPKAINASAIGRGDKLNEAERAVVRAHCATSAEALGYEL